MVSEEKFDKVYEKVKTEYLDYWKNNKYEDYNIVGIGKSIKKVDGKRTGEKCIQFMVKNKLTESELDSKDIIPKEIEGVKTDVVETGEFKAQDTDSYLTEKHRPLFGSVSGTSWNRSACTLGLMVYYKGTTPCVLSNAHCLAPTWDEDFSERQDTWQPSPSDDGTTRDAVASLIDYVDIADEENEPYKVDAALATIYREQDYSSGYATGHPDENQVNFTREIGSVQLTDTVRNISRTTGFTEDEVDATDATASVSFSGLPGSVEFEDLIRTDEDVSEGGDSGSIWLNADGEIVGLHFAGGTAGSLMCKIGNVFDELDITLEKNEDRENPEIELSLDKEVGESSFTMKGSLKSFNDADSGTLWFAYREESENEWVFEELGEFDSEEDETPQSFQRTIDGLDLDENVYEYHISFEENDGRFYGLNKVSNDFQKANHIRTVSALNLDSSTVRLTGELRYSKENDVEVWFEYKKQSDDEWVETGTQTLSEAGTYTETVENLDELEDYEFRAVGEW